MDDDKRQAANDELAHIADEILDARRRRDHERHRRLESLYADVLHEGRELTLHEMRDVVEEYLVSQCIDRDGPCDFPSLRTVAHDESNPLGAACRDVMFLMKCAEADGKVWTVRRGCEEAEKAAARFITHRGIR